MKTIHLFAQIKGGKLKGKRRSESPEAQPGETHVATLHGQPDDYWDRFTGPVKPGVGVKRP